MTKKCSKINEHEIEKKKYAVKKFYFFSKSQQNAVKPFFCKNCDKTFFKKKKLDILKMSKKKILKILLSQFFAKCPKYPLFTIKFSVMLYFFYKIVDFKGVVFFKISYQKLGLPVSP